MRLQHIGECGVKLGEQIGHNYPYIPFEKMRGFRNRITHDYAGIDDLIVWNTITDSLPQLKKWVRAIT